MKFKGDFGLATSRHLLQGDNPSSGTGGFVIGFTSSHSNQASLSLTGANINDSVSLSGAVGTTLYVAPELQTPCSKNKYFYTQVNLTSQKIITLKFN